jgi:hypothetical protein
MCGCGAGGEEAPPVLVFRRSHGVHGHVICCCDLRSDETASLR